MTRVSEAPSGRSAAIASCTKRSAPPNGVEAAADQGDARRQPGRGPRGRRSRLREQLVDRRVHAVHRQPREALAHLAAAAAVVAAGPAGVVARHDAMRDPPRPPLVLAARAEERHDRRAHGRGDVHGRGVDAEEEPRARRERAQLAQRELRPRGR